MNTIRHSGKYNKIRRTTLQGRSAKIEHILCYGETGTKEISPKTVRDKWAVVEYALSLLPRKQ